MVELPFHYEVRGEGELVILLHAGVCDSRMWDAQMDALVAGGWQVARFDMRGWGQSPLPDGEVAHHEDVIALCDALGAETVWLVGASYGGRVALDTCLAYPARVRGLSLLAPAVSGWQGGSALERFGAEEDALLEAGNIEAATALNIRMWVDGPYRAADSVPDELRRNVGEMQEHAFRLPEPPNVSFKPLTPPAFARLSEITAPTLVIVGALDVPDFVTLADHVALTIPAAQLRVVSNAAHLPSMEQPNLVSAMLLEALNTYHAPSP